MRTAKSRKELRNRILAIALDFHKRAFGDEMARVNFLPLAERKKYLGRVRKRIHAHRN